MLLLNLLFRLQLYIHLLRYLDLYFCNLWFLWFPPNKISFLSPGLLFANNYLFIQKIDKRRITFFVYFDLLIFLCFTLFHSNSLYNAVQCKEIGSSHLSTAL